MTKSEAKRYVAHCAATILENGSNSFLDEVPDGDTQKVREAFNELVTRLKTQDKGFKEILAKIESEM